MKFFYEYPGNDWKLLPVDYDKLQRIPIGINDPKSFTIPLDRWFYQLVYEGLDSDEEDPWDEDNTDLPFMKIVAAKDGEISVTDAAEINAPNDLDDVELIGMWKLVRFDDDGAGHAMLTVEGYHAQLYREEFDEATNTITTFEHEAEDNFVIKSFPNPADGDEMELYEADGSSAVTFDNDENNGRGVYIVAREPVPYSELRNNAPSWSYVNDGGNGVDDGVIGKVDIADDDFYGATVANGDAAANTYAELEITFDALQQPQEKSTLTIKILTDTVTGMYIYMYNYATASYTLLWSDNSGSVSLTLTFHLTDNNGDYWDPANSEVKFKVKCTSGFLGMGFQLYGWVDYIRWDYTHGRQHDPIEFEITDTKNSDELEVSIDAGTHDLLTTFANIGDPLYIVADNDEFLEDTVSTLALDINAINAPVAGLPSYTLLRNTPVHSFLSMARNSEAWYSYLTRTTTSEKPDLTFVEKSTPVDNCIHVYPEHCTIQPRYGLNFLQKMRQVKVQNSDSEGRYPADPVAISNYPAQTVSDRTMPTAYLLAAATSIYGQRNAITPAIKFTCDRVSVFQEDFRSYAEDHRIRDEASPRGFTWNAWTVNADCDFTRVTATETYGNFVDASAVASQTIQGSFDTARAAVAGDEFGWSVYITSLSNQNFIARARSGAAGFIYFYIGYSYGDNVYLNSNEGNTTLISQTIEGAWYDVKIRVITATTFDVYTRVDKGTWELHDNSGSHFTVSAGDMNANTIALLQFDNSGGVNGLVNAYIGKIWASWDGDGHDLDVQDVSNAFLHEGVGMVAHFAPTTYGGINYAVNHFAVLRDGAWLPQGDKTSLECNLGFNDASTESLREAREKAIAQSRRDLVS